MADSVLWCLGVLLSCALVYCIYALDQLKVKLNLQTAKLVQLYLDKQFITRIFRMLARSKNEGQAFFDIMSNIKEYFQLDDIIFYNSAFGVKVDVLPGVYKRNMIVQYVDQHQSEILKLLKSKKVVIEKMETDRISSTLYIVALEDDKFDKLVIFVQYGEDGLNISDLETLSCSISVILATIDKKRSLY